MKVLKEGFSIESFFDTIQEHSLLMLDYDGTLSPFTIKRLQAVPYPGVAAFLAAAKQLDNMRIVIISGRQLSELEQLLGPTADSLELWGSHGLERKFENGERLIFRLDPLVEKGIQRGVKVCKAVIAPSQCEIKPFSIAVHWRGLPPSERNGIQELLIPLWEKLCQHYPLELHRFDQGMELRPQGMGKGNAVSILLKEALPQTTIAYFGDDMTDEEAFKALGNNGLKVLVREELRPSLADLQLTPPDEFLCFLERWKDQYASRH